MKTRAHIATSDFASDSDEKLVRLVQTTRSEGAFSELHDRHLDRIRQRIYYFCWRRSIPVSLREEALRDAPFILLEAVRHFRVMRKRGPESTFAWYLGFFVLSRLLDLVKQANRYRRHHHPEIRTEARFEPELGRHARVDIRRSLAGLGINDPGEEVERQEQVRMLKKFVPELPEKERAVVEGFLGDVPWSALAKRLGVSRRTIERQWHKALARLAERVK